MEALGKDRVIGVLMPNGEQADIDCSHMLVNHLGIKRQVFYSKDFLDNCSLQFIILLVTNPL